MKRDTPEQEARAEQLERAALDRKTERLTIKERYAKQMQRDLEKADEAMSRAMHRCLDAGLSKSRVGRIIGTADWKTINNYLALTEAEFVVETVAPAERAEYVRWTIEVDHSKQDMRVVLNVRGDGNEIRKTPRRIKFQYRAATSMADLNYYSAPLDEFDLTDPDLVEQIRQELQDAVPPGRAIRVRILGAPEPEERVTVPAWMRDAPQPGTPEYDAWIDGEE